MPYIDKDLLLKDIDESVRFTVRNAETSPELRGARKIIDRIKSQPIADVVKVVRCKDCRYKDECWQKIDCEYAYKEIVYCSYGEREDK